MTGTASVFKFLLPGNFGVLTTPPPKAKRQLSSSGSALALSAPSAKQRQALAKVMWKRTIRALAMFRIQCSSLEVDVASVDQHVEAHRVIDLPRCKGGLVVRDCPAGCYVKLRPMPWARHDQPSSFPLHREPAMCVHLFP